MTTSLGCTTPVPLGVPRRRHPRGSLRSPKFGAKRKLALLASRFARLEFLWDTRRVGETAELKAIADRVFREESGRIVASLIRISGSFDLAEEAMQEAFAAALAHWPARGVPEKPGAWIMAVAHRKLIDGVRRSTTRTGKQDALTQEAQRASAAGGDGANGRPVGSSMALGNPVPGRELADEEGHRQPADREGRELCSRAGGQPGPEPGRDTALPGQGDADQGNYVIDEYQKDGENESAGLAAFLRRKSQWDAD